MNPAVRTFGSQGIRQAIANCYLQTGMPALLRPVRDRYQVSAASGGKRLPVRLEKRTEPSVRILFYHRVNDDNDPFFPSIPTALFEQEMRFIRRHYRVVSLAEIPKTLSGSCTEPVLAITFDDGYRDNYLSAFPVLERYGLPATIFLTTGSIDSREPLWFERLALALKTTSRDFVDLALESGISRRYGLHSTEERLSANEEIFGVLRGLPDSEKAGALDRILQDLGRLPDEHCRRGKMLTWDDIRFMNGRGIDFGGHTVTHPFLSQMPKEKAVWEISECRRRIEEELQAPISYFAYPNGRREDYCEATIELLRNAGYQGAVTTIWGINYRSTDPMELRRGGPWEETQAMFAWKLDWYQFVNG